MEKENSTAILCKNSMSPSGHVQPLSRIVLRNMRKFDKIVSTANAQIEIEAFDSFDKKQAEEIALIIAEIYILPETASIRIAGNDLPAEMVSQIFSRLEHEHVEHVIRHYRDVKHEIKFTKTYLRTALYNSIFEIESRITNEVEKDMYQS